MVRFSLLILHAIIKLIMTIATVYIIGAGPGDPELITIKAKRILESADVVLYDYLAHPNIVLMASNAEKVCVGKKKGYHSMKQESIHDLLLKYSSKVNSIVRLKGGDPMVFGRCGEEMDFLKDHKIKYEIIPGITSAIAAPTYSGIPITHRDFSHSVAFVTATRANDIQNMNIPTADTLILMMSLLRLRPLIQRLLELRDKSTPVAIVESGTLAQQKQLVGTLETIVKDQEEAQLKPPALMIIGKVAALGEKFKWRDHLPLRNRRFVLFRAMHQQSHFREKLQTLGAEVLTLPLNQIEPVNNAFKKDDLNKYTYIIFTSENGVNSFFKNLINQQSDIRKLSELTIVAIGAHTSDALKQKAIIPDLIPKDMNSAGIIKLLKNKLKSSDKVLIPTSSEAAEDIKEGLKETGATINQMVIYKNNEVKNIDVGLSWIKLEDELIFMNSASVNRFSKKYKNMFKHQIFSIGPQTTKTLLESHCRHVHQSTSPSIDSMIERLLKTKNE